MRHGSTCGILLALCISATAQAVIILPAGKPKPPPDPSKVVIDLGEIRLGPKEQAQVVCPDDPAWAYIQSVQLTGRLPTWCSCGTDVWLCYQDTLGQTVTAGRRAVLPREFIYLEQVPWWGDGVVVHLQNLADKKVTINNGSLTIVYGPDPATAGLVAVGALGLFARRRF